MSRLAFGLGLLACLSAPLFAQPAAPQFKAIPLAPPAEPDAIALWPDGHLPPTRISERWNRMIGTFGDQKVDDRSVRNVVLPTITPVLPDPTRATGAAVIVAPGGAFQSLSIDSEGYRVAHWLADHGIAAFVLKYRLLETPVDDQAFLAQMGAIFAQAAVTPGNIRPDIKDPMATEDALQALRVVRARAARWNVDPGRVGMIGYSAGAMTSLQAVLNAKGADMPAFFGYIYGPMAKVAVPPDAAPMFAAFALDDGLFGRSGFGIVEAWHDANRPVELHAFERGDHGFGMGRTGTTSTLVMDEFLAWLQSRNLLHSSGVHR